LESGDEAVFLVDNDIACGEIDLVHG
jgi:hypothetical protein